MTDTMFSDAVHSTSQVGSAVSTPILPADRLPARFTHEDMERMLSHRSLRNFSPLKGGTHGGMSFLFECRDTEINQRRVVKIPNRLDEATCERFFCEAEILTKITDKRIVRLYDYRKVPFKCADGRELQLPYCVMEFVEGCSMEQYVIAAPKPGQPPAIKSASFSLKAKLRVAIECCLAMQAAHTQGDGILHRDLKPSNIMIVGSGDCLSVRIIDFGIAYLPGISSGHTQIATDRYAAPEQRCSDGLVTVCTDIYLLGGTLYDWFAGRGDASQPWPSDLPPVLEKVLMKATEKQQNKRHQSMAHFRAEFEKVLEWVIDAERHPLATFEETVRAIHDSRSRVERLGERRLFIGCATAIVLVSSLIWLGWLEMLFLTGALVLLLLHRLRPFWLRAAAAGLLIMSVPAMQLSWFSPSLEERQHQWEQQITRPRRVRVELAGLTLSHLAKSEAFINQLVVDCIVVINGKARRLRSMLVPQVQLQDSWLNSQPGKWPSAIDPKSIYAVEFDDVVPKSAFVEITEGKLIDDEILDDDLGSFSITQALVSLKDGGFVTATTVGGDAGGRYSGSDLTFRISIHIDGVWVPLSAPE
jgi:serine/threonine protein kinase